MIKLRYKVVRVVIVNSSITLRVLTEEISL